MAKWRSPTLPSESVTNKNKQDEKHRTFVSRGGVRNQNLTKLSVMIAEVSNILEPRKLYCIRRIVSPSSPLGGAENLGKNTQPRLNLRNSIIPPLNPKFKYLIEGGTTHKPWKFRENFPRNMLMRGVYILKFRKIYSFGVYAPTPAPMEAKFVTPIFIPIGGTSRL